MQNAKTAGKLALVGKIPAENTQFWRNSFCEFW
jgi:hypothetical protein